jgi:primosomal protein N' (replication factor Y)
MSLEECPVPFRRSRPLYADVIVPRHIAKAFTYLVPAELVQALEIGDQVLVPFGRATLEGAVIALRDHPPAGVQPGYLREIRSRTKGSGDPAQTSALFELSRKIADRYVAPWGQCLRLVFPPTPSESAAPVRYVATDRGRAALKDGSCPEPLRPVLGRIARRSGGVLSSTLQLFRDSKSRQVVKALESNSWIAVVGSNTEGSGVSRRRATKPPEQADPETGAARTVGARELPEPDRLWGTRVAEVLRANRAQRIVLHAPWEFRVSRLVGAVQQVHAMNRSTIILAAQAARAEWLGQLVSSLTKLPVTLYQPSLRSAAWASAQDGRPSIIVGTRTAVFAPLHSIGLIWVDGEDDPGFKEPQEPRFHAREVACMRAEVEHALVVLASAHPSLESKADPIADMDAVQPDPAHRPAIELVDLREQPGGTPFSQRLIEAMRDAVASKAGVLLFLNRKGYAGALICRDCGWVPRCDVCAVALAYYREAGRLVCRYCGAGTALPDCCPTCQASRLSPVGEGTERVEVEARRLFPNARIARLDGETLRRSASARSLWDGARSGSWDILIGTQALFQREPLPHRGLVGILQADSGLNVPDFRAAERTYQLLVDAVSLARPASAGGLVILQTRLAAHPAVQAVAAGEPDRFYDEELVARRLLSYPPACHLANLSVAARDLRLVEAAASRWRASLEESLGGREAVMILGPVPAIGGRPKGYHRRQILVKGFDGALLSRGIRESVETMERIHQKGQVKFIVDVDPVEMG